MNYRTLAVCAFALLVPKTVLPQTGGTISAGEYIAKYQVESPRRLVDYCISEQPTLRGALTEEFGLFQTKIAAASEGILKRGAADLSKPVPMEIQEGFEDIARKTLEEVKKYDSQSYCTWLLGSLQRTTTESLKAKIESAYDRYDEIARSRTPPAAK